MSNFHRFKVVGRVSKLQKGENSVGENYNYLQ